MTLARTLSSILVVGAVLAVVELSAARSLAGAAETEKTVPAGNLDAPGGTAAGARADGGKQTLDAPMEDQLKALADKVNRLEAIVEAQQRVIEDLRNERRTKADATVPAPGDIPVPVPAMVEPVKAEKRGPAAEPENPLTLKIGPNASLTPFGRADFTAFFRTTNTGSNAGTSFNGIPFGNTLQGNMTETRFTAMPSRFGLRVDADVKGSHVIGYFETDFTGNNPSNLYVTANSNVNRMRLYWVDFRKGAFEVTAGQFWSLITPNRDGVGTFNDNVFTTLNIDQNMQVGLPWARQAGIRFIFHAGDNLQVGLSVENPQQYISSGEVTFPSYFADQIASQFDAAGNPAAPNLLPDLIGKVAYDSRTGRNVHLEVAGFVRTFKAKVTPSSGLEYTNHTAFGYGASVGLNVEVARDFRLISNFFFSRGGGRYLFGLGPDLVVVPRVAGNAAYTIDLEPVTAYSAILGFEYRINRAFTVDAYYGGAYFGRNTHLDVTSPLAVKPWVGFGGENAPNTATRAYQEVTGGVTWTFWKDNRYGTLQWVGQASYLTKAPWFVGVDSPRSADCTMVFSSLRYTFPGEPPVPKK